MLLALALSAAMLAPPQSVQDLEEAGACYSAAVGVREMITADHEAGYVEPGDEDMLAFLLEIETAAGARMDAMKAVSDTLSDADLRAMDERIGERLNGYDEAAFGAFMDQCIADLGLDAA